MGRTHRHQNRHADGAVAPTVPLRVDYELTALGQSLVPIMRALKDWSEHNMTAIGKARDTFDARRKL